MNWNPFKRKQKNPLERGFREIIGLGGVNKDWPLTSLADDAEMWQNAYALTSRCRDLMRTNTTYQKYRDTLFANIFGENGITLRMNVKEQEDRVVYSPDEKAALLSHEKRINRLRNYAAKQRGDSIEQYRALHMADYLEMGEERSLSELVRGTAKVTVGQPDLYANQLIEAAWLTWQRAGNADARGQRDYKALRHLRLISAVRDGDFFIRMIRSRSVNDFGFTLQLINAEWCDRFLNCTLDNGNEVRMGIEYKFNDWGIGKVVAYYFIKRAPKDWQFNTPGSMGFGGVAPHMHQRVPAEDIIHYCRVVDADGTRPAPWIASTIPKARQLDQYMLAEVIAAREAACKVGFLYSDVLPEGGMPPNMPDPTRISTQSFAPGETRGLPWGVKYQGNDPKHPNGNAEAFRMIMLRDQCAGMPGASYSVIGGDYANINFSAGRLERLMYTEEWKILQRNDIDVAEIPIFENWLEMSLLLGTIPLPLAKFRKFNKPAFAGRRWDGVDPIKDATSAALRVANHISNLTLECADRGLDFDDVAIKRAEEKMVLNELGLSDILTVESTPFENTGQGGTPLDDSADPEKPSATKPGDKKPAIKKDHNRLNGVH